MGFIIGASEASNAGMSGANKFKTVFEPYRNNNSVPTPYIRISSNNATSGNAYDYSGSTTNSAIWLNSLTLNEGWNTISLYVSGTEIKQYINGTLIRTVSDLTIDSGYIGLYTAVSDTAFRNFSFVSEDPAKDTSKTVVACVGDNEEFSDALATSLGNGYQVLNFGVNGATAVKGYANTYAYTDEYFESLEALPDVVIIALGNYDTGDYWNKLNGFFEDDLTELINSYKELPSGPDIYLCGAHYCLNEDSNMAIINTVNPTEASVAITTGAQVINLYALFDGKNDLINGTYGLTSGGALVMAEKIFVEAFDTVYGDANNDKTVNILDLVAMKKAASNSSLRVGTDVNFDGTVNGQDFVLMIKVLLGIEDGFEVVADNVFDSTSPATKVAAMSLNGSSISTKLSSTTTLIKSYDSTWDFSHAPFITMFKGKFYAMWDSGHDGEGNIDQRILLSTSTDAVTWSTPTVLAAPDDPAGTMGSLGFYTDGNTLVAYYGYHIYTTECLQNNGTFRPLDEDKEFSYAGNYLKYTSDGVTWSEPVDLEYGPSLTTAPVRTSSGKLFMVGGYNYLYTTDLTGITGWTVGKFPTEAARAIQNAGTVERFVEGSIYELENGKLRLVFRTNTNYLWCSESLDDGVSWTAPYQTNITDDKSKVKMGVLPDGRYFYIGNPVPSNSRNPLVLGVSEDGDSFTGYILRNEGYTIQKPGLYKSGTYAYPYACFDNDYMYIIYSKGKEVIEITKVALNAF